MTIEVNIERFRYWRGAVMGRVEVINTDTGELLCNLCSLERQDLMIPSGKYPLKYEWSPKFKDMLWELYNVPGRSEIKFHKGNSLKDTEGCILIAKYFYRDDYLGQSKNGLAELHMALSKGTNNYVTIK